MKDARYIIFFIAAALACSCNADMSVHIAAPIIKAPVESSIEGTLQGRTYTLNWPESEYLMEVSIYEGGEIVETAVTADNFYVHSDIERNVEYIYVLKFTDGTNFSKGTLKTFIKRGAGECSGLKTTQIEREGGYDAKVEWSTEDTDATAVSFAASNGKGRDINEEIPVGTEEYVIDGVITGDTWTVTLIARNDEGESMPVADTFTVKNMEVAYLSMYGTPDELIANGDDDEAYGWIWFHKEYPQGEYLPFSSISSAESLNKYGTLFFMRDIEDSQVDAFTFPESVTAATPFIKAWYKEGGNLLLWGYAVTYIGHIGRISLDMLKKNDNAIGRDHGSHNGDTWKMAVQLAVPGFTKDFSSHPIYNGLEAVPSGDTKFIAVKGPGFTEDNNCVFFNIPSVLTNIENQKKACYDALTSIYGIYPLGVWDSQITWISQLNVWEARQGNTDFKGTVLCVGNGGCNFYMKQMDGTYDLSKPSANSYQDNIEKMARNALDYLRTL